MMQTQAAPQALAQPQVPAGATRQQIEQVYQNQLGRASDAGGMDWWANAAEQGASLDEIRAGIRGSTEAGRYREVSPGGRLESGLGGAVTDYEQALGRSGQGLEQMTGTLDPWAQGGQAAFEKQQAMSGALGPEAQQAAYDEFSASPGQDYLQEQMRREGENYATSIGQTQGGNVLAELQRRALGLAQQDFGNQFNRLGSVASTGGQAASQLATGQLGSGQFDAGMLGQRGQMRYGAGQTMAGQLGQTTSALAGLQNLQGQTDSSIYGQGAVNIGNVLGQAGAVAGQMPMDVATLLANLATQQGSQQAPYAAAQGAWNAQGTQGQYDAYGNMIGAGLDAWEQR